MAFFRQNNPLISHTSDKQDVAHRLQYAFLDMKPLRFI